MRIFEISLEDRPGTFAAATQALSQQDVNVLIFGLGGTQAAFVTDNEEGARSALGSGGIEFRESEALTVKMEDKPGQAAAVARQLAEAGINLRSWLPVDTRTESFTVALVADDVDAAREVLAEQLAR